MEQKFPVSERKCSQSDFCTRLVKLAITRRKRGHGAAILFVGTLCYFPNIQAVLWFATEVLPCC